MGERIPVLVDARDPISRAGIVTQLRSRPEIRVLEDADPEPPTVGVVVAEEVDGETARIVKTFRRNGCAGVVLVLSSVDDAGLLSAIEGGVSGLLRRGDATADALVKAVSAAAAGEGTVPGDLLGRLLTQLGRIHEQVLGPRGLTFAGLTQREIEVLKLVAEGLSTEEIAQRLSYSERTIKNVIHDVMARFQLRNRSHAVAYAIKAGLI